MAGRRRPVLIAAFALAAAGCSSSGAHRASHESRPPVSLDQNARGRRVVATVDGAPIYEDCVTSQARAAGVSKRTALDQCIEFELMARAALPRYGTSREVYQTRKREMVRALLAGDFEPTADAPSDVPVAWLREKLWTKDVIRQGFNHPEYRVVAFALAAFEKKMVDPEHDRYTRELAEEWMAALRSRDPDEGPLTVDEFEDTVHRVLGDRERKYSFDRDYRTPRHGMSVEPFASAVFALHKGELSDIVRSRYGYFIILLRDIMPAVSTSFEEAVPEMRRQIFDKWRTIAYADFVQDLLEEAAVTRFPDRLKAVHLDIPEAFSAPEGP